MSSGLWPMKKIEDLCQKVTSGGTPSRKDLSNFVASSSDGHPWLKTKELSDSFVYDTEEYITTAAINSSSAKILPTDTVVMAMYGATVGKLGMLGRPMTCNQAVCALIADPKVSDARFLFYALLNNRDELVKLASGSAQQNLSTGVIKKFLLPCPSLNEQHDIAKLLGGLDDLIEVNRKILRNILDLSRALLSSAVNEDTKRVRLATIAEINPSRAQRADDTEVIYLAIADVKDGSINWPGPVLWTEAPVASRLISQKGDVIWSRVRPNRRSHALLPETTHQVVVSTGMVVLRPKHVSSAYLMAVCDSESFSDRLEAMTGGTAYPTVDAVDYSNIEVPLIDEDARELFDATMSPLWEAFGSLEQEILDLSRARNELMPLLISGRLRVKDVV